MALDPEVADRVAKLLRLALSSGPDPEKLMALGRLSAIAAAADVDWDEALDGASPGLRREQMMEIFEAGVRRGIEIEQANKGNSGGDWATAGTSRADEVGERAGEPEVILDAAARSRSDGLLSGWYATFSSDMENRFANWGTCTRVSERQWEFLNKLRSILERQDYL
jgi:hypothetical protein